MESQRPVILICPGAFHSQIHYLLLAEPLRREGYDLAIPELPSVGRAADLGKVHLADDVNCLRLTMQPYLEAGREIIVVVHSYGGLPVTDAVVGCTVHDRKENGKKGGVRAIVAITAFLPPQRAMSLLACIGATRDDPSKFPDWWEVQDEEGIVKHNKLGKAAQLLPNDDTIATMAANIVSWQSFTAFCDPVTHAGSDIRAEKTFIVCEQDGSIPEFGQVAFAEACGARMIRIDAGHAPFLDVKHTEVILNVIRGYAEL